MGTKILLASPLEESRILAQQVLESTDYDLVTSETYEHASKEIKDPDVFIFLCSLELAFPEECFDLLKKYKEQDKERKSIVLLTPDCPNKLKFAARKAGVSGWLFDPLQTKAFVGLIKKLII